MVGPSKILTVSYGTFSCTLEGFDDPFSTMRGIAEYFRDLAADDRYFGAEPPTPDAEMLHKIAEREIQRRVEARVEDNGIILRQMEDQSRPPLRDSAEPVAQTPQPAAAAQPAAPSAAARAESVAAKLARIRAAVSQREDDAGHVYSDDSHVTDMIPAAPLASRFVDAEDAAESEPEQAEDPAPEPETIAEESLTELDEDQDDPVDTAEVESVEVEEDFDEDAVDPAESPEMAASEPVAEVEDEFEDSAVTDAEDEAEIEVEEAAEPVAEIEDEEPLVSELDEDEVEAVAEAEEAEIAAEAEDDQPEEEDVEQHDAAWTAAEFADAEEDEAEDALASEAEEETAEAEEDDSSDALSRVMGQLTAEAEEDSELAPEEGEEAPDAPAIARVIQMRRSDEADEEEGFEAETETAEAEAEADEPDHFVLDLSKEDRVDDEDDQPEPEAAGEVQSDEDDEEDDLMATLEQVQRESDADLRADKEGRSVLESQDLEQDDDGVQRILDVTNTELEESEGTRRRSAIQHLKAAVMATRADRKMAKEKAAEDDAKHMDQYREDLARVVRPRRPAEGGKSTERRLAPLVLVSEQRVDAEPVSAERAEAVRPRRVSAARMGAAEDVSAEDADVSNNEPENIFADADSFADFAEQMGASSLPDLLEAAAAYASYVEGRPHFSRPQIMRAVQPFGGEDGFNREDSLRSFGQLLRHGKIRKLSRGQFTVSQSTRFNPGARAAGE